MNPDIFHINLYHVAAMATLFSGFTLALLLAFAKRESQAANLYLSAALIIIVLKTGGLSPIFLPALGPLLYFYVRRITASNLKFDRKDVLHFCPLLIAYWMPGWLVLISVVIYLYLSHRLIQHFYNRLQPVLMDRPRFAFRRLDKVLHLLGLLCVLWLFNDVLSFAVAFVLMGVAAEVILKLDSSTQLATPITDRYDAKEKSRRLKEAVAANRFYEDAELTLASLAVKLNIHPHDLSRIINAGMEKNFSDFINEFRVRETARKMQDPSYDRLTLLGIAYESGFNSQRTFNRVFKEMTGKTPVEYKKGLKKELPNDKLATPSPLPLVILRSGSLPSWTPVKSNRNFMFKNYFKIAWRNLMHNKSYATINVTGLAVGVSAALSIYIIVSFDLNFDKFHNESNRIYRVVTDFSFMDKVVARLGMVNGPFPAVVKTETTGVKTAASFLEMKETDVLIPNETAVPVKFRDESSIVLADDEYFNLFNYKWLAGSPHTALQKPYEVVLTSDQAGKYFPNVPYNQLLGKTVIYDSIKTTVSGIVQTPAHNTDFYFKDFISYPTCLYNNDLKNVARLTEWPGVVWQLFIKIDEHANAADIEKRINGSLKKYNKEFRPGDGQMEHLQAFRDLHFDPAYANFEKGRRASRTTLYSLLVVAGFLLLLGCINFINLSTAQAAQRAKEIGVRKTMGSSRWQLIVLFLSETFIVTLAAICIAMALTPVILKFFTNFIPPGISVNYLDVNVFLFLLMLLITVTLLAGLYPAIILSGYRPVSVLNNLSNKDTGNSKGTSLRKSLSVTQFVIAQFFIMTTLLVNKQVFYALHKDMGFRKDGIINISTPLNTINSNKQQLFKDKISRIPQIELMSIGSEPPANEKIGVWEVAYQDGKKEVKTTLQQRNGDENYLKVYRIKLLAGRNLQPADSMTAVLVNEKYTHIIGFQNPANAIGASFDYEGNKRMIVGVVADFHQKSLRDPIMPMSIQAPHYHFNDRFFHILLKPQTAGNNDWSNAISSMKKAWIEVYPDIEFDYHFFDEEVAHFYESEQRTSKLLGWATGLSILISCLGLLGLTIFNINRRTREIGVRKVLGASVTQIVKLLSSEIAWLIVLSFILVMPLAWFAMNKWLQNFADHTAISWWIFVLSGVGMLFAALMTSVFQTVRAASANPVKSLRND